MIKRLICGFLAFTTISAQARQSLPAITPQFCASKTALENVYVVLTQSPESAVFGMSVTLTPMSNYRPTVISSPDGLEILYCAYRVRVDGRVTGGASVQFTQTPNGQMKLRVVYN